jgi:hypothetical protein
MVVLPIAEQLLAEIYKKQPYGEASSEGCFGVGQVVFPIVHVQPLVRMDFHSDYITKSLLCHVFN